ncbi:MAG: hypothetical protein JGK17_28535 [Microcoleus sp. PH2017_10_PVI_O_A]|uniref:hypothetical protein n=1 Tax=unclassified Microcoleus TaxID=2642155 RepID=UPI001DE5FCA5|nr:MULTISPECIES: hypothetical protein [unclassified Microcoleus]TAE75657.1 MAG: hypothetical protein EAZ83_29055 [Oscillatoriales cyanobacterium]MCC3409431.1 hypothetical protein [Microcoleus sp. PH2017_10_PVI_O_A]MCC3463684.1 hypothetical protein [Microcoleus sp. PH2017_11_PCY_U_A]MCC3482047.1 hypothetical protein [Microcoleus sp. PH2017_12_PCY_D_A]MCC3531918.1 hypothetical protein [Microcoleus sp. PH2017_21_RUC_O_A]
MSQKLKSLSSALILAIASAALASVKPAQADTARFSPVDNNFNRQFFEASGDFYHNVSLQGYMGDYLGIGSPSGVVAFPEKEIERDASRISGLYRRVMQRQVSSDPILRVPDATNPFDASVMALPPACQLAPQASGCFATPAGVQEQFPPAQQQDSQAAPGPVRGLYNVSPARRN